MFKVGQRVVCVNSSIRGPQFYHTTPLTEGRVYIVSRDTFLNYLGNEAIELVGMDNRPLGYRSIRFRPVVDRKTDISIFTEILRRETVPADLDRKVALVAGEMEAVR